MNFSMVFKGIAHTLILQAEDELGPGKGPEKKAWVLAKLDELMKLKGINAFLASLIHGLADILMDSLVKGALADLGKLDGP